MALAGTVQTTIVTGLARRGIPAVGLSGADAGSLRARLEEGGAGRPRWEDRAGPRLLVL